MKRPVYAEVLELSVPSSYAGRYEVCLGWSQTFSHINTPTFLKPRYFSYLPAY